MSVLALQPVGVPVHVADSWYLQAFSIATPPYEPSSNCNVILSIESEGLSPREQIWSDLFGNAYEVQLHTTTATSILLPMACALGVSQPSLIVKYLAPDGEWKPRLSCAVATIEAVSPHRSIARDVIIHHQEECDYDLALLWVQLLRGSSCGTTRLRYHRAATCSVPQLLRSRSNSLPNTSDLNPPCDLYTPSVIARSGSAAGRVRLRHRTMPFLQCQIPTALWTRLLSILTSLLDDDVVAAGTGASMAPTWIVAVKRPMLLPTEPTRRDTWFLKYWTADKWFRICQAMNRAGSEAGCGFDLRTDSADILLVADVAFARLHWQFIRDALMQVEVESCDQVADEVAVPAIFSLAQLLRWDGITQRIGPPTLKLVDLTSVVKPSADIVVHPLSSFWHVVNPAILHAPLLTVLIPITLEIVSNRSRFTEAAEALLATWDAFPFLQFVFSIDNAPRIPSLQKRYTEALRIVRSLSATRPAAVVQCDRVSVPRVHLAEWQVTTPFVTLHKLGCHKSLPLRFVHQVTPMLRSERVQGVLARARHADLIDAGSTVFRTLTLGPYLERCRATNLNSECAMEDMLVQIVEDWLLVKPTRMNLAVARYECIDQLT